MPSIRFISYGCQNRVQFQGSTTRGKSQNSRNERLHESGDSGESLIWRCFGFGILGLGRRFPSLCGPALAAIAHIA